MIMHMANNNSLELVDSEKVFVDLQDILRRPLAREERGTSPVNIN